VEPSHVTRISPDVVEVAKMLVADDVPLVVDLDGTLLRSDLLVESFSALVATDPLMALNALRSLVLGKAAFKARIARDSRIDVSTLPWDDAVIHLIEGERRRGRRIYLASASNERLVAQIDEHLGLFDGIFASTDKVNLSGAAKAKRLCHAFEPMGFDYAGNADTDLPVWDKARQVILVNAGRRLERTVRARWPEAVILSPLRFQPHAYLKAIRVHQWLKNLLLFVPVLGAHRWSIGDLAICLLAFLAFSFCASSVYVTNDLLDLVRDRAHRTKRYRPFAAGTIPVLGGVILIPLLLILAICLAALVGTSFLLVLGLYYAMTLVYSVYLKRRVMLDVVLLAALYGVRMFAGAVATGVVLSAWLGAFSLFFFTSLALLKRCSELRDRSAHGLGDPSGRGYRIGDLPIIEALAAASGFTAVLVFGLYANSDAVQLLYRSPNRLWLVCVVLVYWLGRALILTHRNEMHEDPVVFAATDRTSQVCALLTLSVIVASV
jgi:4-hydroxybenzoate polyprenyltransferase/phosphoserine phosphatase